MAKVAVSVENTDAPSWIYERLLPHAAKNATGGGMACSGAVSHALALLAASLGLTDDAARWFGDALGRYENSGWLPLAADANVAYAGFLSATDPGRARALAEKAHHDAIRLGLAGVERDANEVLRVLSGTTDHARPTTRLEARRRDRIRGKATAGGQRMMARLVDGSSDEELVRRFGSPLAQRAIFSGMARAFQPAMAFGFEGTLSFELLIPSQDAPASSAWWTIQVRGKRATARPGRATDSAVTIHIPMADFIRMAGGELPMGSLMEGDITFGGDPMLLLHASAMFGAVAAVDVVDAKQ